MTGDRVHRLGLPAVAFRRAGVEHRCHRTGGELVGRQRQPTSGVQVVVSHRDVTVPGVHRTGLQRAAGGQPGRQPAIENAHSRNPGGGQDPPGARRARTVPVVVHHDGLAGPDAPAAGGDLQRGTGRQRVTTATGPGVVAEIVIERDVHRAGNMPGEIGRQAVGLVQPPAHVEDRRWPAAGKVGHQLLGGDQHRIPIAHGCKGIGVR